MRPWLVLLAVVAAAQIILVTLPYLDARTAPLMPHDGFPQYRMLILIHVAFATVATFAAIAQMSPKLRLRYPVGHRWIGRLYMVTTLIAGLLGFVILPYAPAVGRIGVGFATVLWLAFSVMGFVRARQRRIGEHRRMMTYAFAVVLSNIGGTAFVKIGSAVLGPDFDQNYLLEGARWLGWTINLMIAQWWLDRTAKRPLANPSFTRVQSDAPGSARLDPARADKVTA